MIRSLILASIVVFGFALNTGCGGPPASSDDGGSIEVDAGAADAGSNPGDDDGGVDAGTLVPDTMLTSAPNGAVSSSSAQFEFSSDLSAATFECSLDQAGFASCTSPAEYAALKDGPHVFSVRARSPVGVEDPSPAEATWTVDTLAPETTIVAGPPATGGSSYATFEFSSSEANGTFECALDGAAFTGCESPWTSAELGSGSHTFEVRAIDAAGNVDPSPASATWSLGSIERIRIMAANITSGNYQSYDPGNGTRIFQGLHPDVVMIQEFNYGSNSEADIRSFVDTAFGTSFSYTRESGAQIPNGVISRYPILSSGNWTDPKVSNRSFVWAQIDVPGPKDLWAVSMHLLTSSSSNRAQEATALVTHISASIPPGDYLVIGGDFNTDTRSEACIGTFSQVVVTSGVHPADQNGDEGTNASRSKPYDWVLADPDLDPLETSVVIGSSTYADGLVFDSRVYSPLSEVSPVLAGDSAASNMQHMAVVRDFVVPY